MDGLTYKAHRSGSPALTAWVQKQKDRLRAGESSAVLATLKRAWQTTPKTGPGNKAKRLALKRTWFNLHKNRERLSYQKCRACGSPIGSGNAEGAVRNLIEIRHEQLVSSICRSSRGPAAQTPAARTGSFNPQALQ